MTIDNTRGESHAETARQSDDSAIIDNSHTAPSQQGRSGGNLQRDVATQAEERRARDPEAHQGVDKGDDISHGPRSETRHPAEHVVTDRD